MPAALLAALDSEGQIHLIVGSNPLASARCAKSIEVGAKPKIIAPADADVHYVLAKRIEDGQVEWIKQGFEESHLSTLGRNEVDNVVDAVFVTSGGKSASSTFRCAFVKAFQAYTFSRHAHLEPMQTYENTRQCCRRSQPLHLHASFHTLRWPSANWYHYIWQRLQARFTDTERGRFNSASQLRDGY